MARRSVQWTTSLLCVFLFAGSALGLENDFSFYPKGAQSCLTQAANQSKCSGSDAAAMNTCLCGNGGNFITNAAACIGKNSSGDVKDTYDVMQKACSTSGTPMEVSQADFMSAASGTTTTKTTSTTKTASSSTNTATSTDAATTTTSQATATTTSPAESSSSSNDKGGLSQGATIGISVGASVGGVAIIAIIAFILFRRYRRRGPESDPMLPTRTNMPTAYPEGGFASYNDFKSQTHSPAPTAPTSTATPASWVTPSTPSFQGHPHPAYAPHGGYAQHQPPVAELASDALPGNTTFSAVEMPGSIPQGQR
ncbi:unnamed protein product [Clonostachys chloroleuca]|uniref:Extracellular membrane protein CFEM domain-containing protein n=1 Tax=Clonostachys chloroleuca TaxID=1926264 RepID=A0AA35Q3K7_9HYPO|nr:unnamed protein product [Clonostachys chloroleuca]